MTDAKKPAAPKKAAAALNLYQRIRAVMDEVQAIPKNGHNDHFNYDYVRETDLVDHLRGLLVKHGLVLLPTATAYNRDGNITRLAMNYVLVNVDNPAETFHVPWYGEATDTQDKGIYKAYTGAEKYALMKLFMVAGEDADPERDSVPAARGGQDRRTVRRDGGGGDRGSKAAPDSENITKLFNGMWARVYKVGGLMGLSRDDANKMLHERIRDEYGKGSTRDLVLDDLQDIHFWLDELEAPFLDEEGQRDSKQKGKKGAGKESQAEKNRQAKRQDTRGKPAAKGEGSEAGSEPEPEPEPGSQGELIGGDLEPPDGE